MAAAALERKGELYLLPKQESETPPEATLEQIQELYRVASDALENSHEYAQALVQKSLGKSIPSGVYPEEMIDAGVEFKKGSNNYLVSLNPKTVALSMISRTPKLQHELSIKIPRNTEKGQKPVARITYRKSQINGTLAPKLVSEINGAEAVPEGNSFIQQLVDQQTDAPPRKTLFVHQLSNLFGGIILRPFHQFRAVNNL